MMPDRKKVIRAVETCFDSWIDKHRDMGLDFHKVEQLKREALELLKEQEPVKPFSYHDIYWCGKCGNRVLERHTVHDGMRLIDADALKDNFPNARADIFENCRNCTCLDNERINQIIDSAPTIGGWISVKDRLPEDEGDVIVYGVSPRGRKKTAIMNYLAFEADRPRWALDGIWTVLYWMPIPEPPKEDN